MVHEDHKERFVRGPRGPLGSLALGGLTISDEGGLEELDEFLESRATSLAGRRGDRFGQLGHLSSSAFRSRSPAFCFSSPVIRRR